MRKKVIIPMDIPKEVLTLVNIFGANGKVLVAAGGCVRDYVMAKPSEDIDLATDAFPEDIEKMLADKNYVLTFAGKNFGVMHVKCKDGVTYEIATFRSDESYGRKPVVKLGVTIEEDATRRDFTFNAMYYDILTHEVIDNVNGLDDISKGIVRCVGNAQQRFDEDRLRMLRAIRFTYRFGFTLADDTRLAIMNRPELIGEDETGKMVPLSRDRINEEFLKMVEQTERKNLWAGIDDLISLGLLQQILPEFSRPYTTPQNKSAELVLAQLMRDKKDGNEVYEHLKTKLEFSKDLSKKVKLLLDARASMQSEDFVALTYAFGKSRKTSDLSDDDVFSFCSLYHTTLEQYTRAVVLSSYHPTVSAAALIANEKFTEGIELGEEIARREAKLINGMRQTVGRGVRGIRTIIKYEDSVI